MGRKTSNQPGRARHGRVALSRVLLLIVVGGALITVPSTPAKAEAIGNPLAGATWFVDPGSNARRQADTWRASRPADAAAIEQIAGQAQAGLVR